MGGGRFNGTITNFFKSVAFDSYTRFHSNYSEILAKDSSHVSEEDLALKY